MIYLVVILLIVFFIFKYDIFENKVGSDFFYFILFIALSLIAGLRYRVGIDTFIYFEEYDVLPNLWNIDSFKFSDYRYDFLWVVFCGLCKLFSPNYFFMQFMHAFIINLIFFYFIRKQTKYKFTAIFFYSVFGFLYFNTEIMRESMAVAISLFAIKYFFEKKWIKYYLIIIVASFIHSSGFILLFFPLASKIKFNKVFFISLLVSLVFINILWLKFNDFIQLFFVISSVEQKANAYLDNDSFIYNLNGIIFSSFMYIVIPLILLFFSKKYSQNNFFYYPFIWLYIFFGQFVIFNSIIFSRFENYLFFPYILFITNLIHQIRSDYSLKTRNPIIILLIVLLLTPYTYTYLKQDFASNSRFYQRYIPYYSIINKQVSPERERIDRNR